MASWAPAMRPSATGTALTGRPIPTGGTQRPGQSTTGKGYSISIKINSIIDLANGHQIIFCFCFFLLFFLPSDNIYWCRWPRLPRDPTCYESCAHGGVPTALPAEGAEARTAPEEHPWLCSLKTVAQLDPAFPSRHRCGVTILSGQPATSVQEAEPQVPGAGRPCWWAPPSAIWCAGARRGRPWTCAAADRCIMALVGKQEKKRKK